MIRVMQVDAVEIWDDNTNELMGRVLIQKTTYGYFIFDLLVLHNHRGKGVAKTLMRKVCHLYGELEIRIHTPNDNDTEREQMDRARLIQFYQRFGFVVDGRYMIRLPPGRGG